MNEQERTQKAIELSQKSAAPAELIYGWLVLTRDNLEIVELAVKSHIPGIQHGENVIWLYLKTRGKLEYAPIGINHVTKKRRPRSK